MECRFVSIKLRTNIVVFTRIMLSILWQGHFKSEFDAQITVLVYAKSYFLISYIVVRFFYSMKSEVFSKMKK